MNKFAGTIFLCSLIATDSGYAMQAVLRELIGEQVPPISVSLGSSSTVEAKALQPCSSFRQFCQLQIEQLLCQIPDLRVRLVYWCQEQSQQQTLVLGAPLETALAIEAQIYLNSDSWWTALSDRQFREIVTPSNYHFYVYRLSEFRRQYLLLSPRKRLSPQHQKSVELCVQLLSYQIATQHELHLQRQARQRLKQTVDTSEHQIRSSIALIELYADLLSSNTTNPQARSQLDLIQTSIRDVNRHLKQITATPQPPVIATHDLKDIVAKTLQRLQPWLDQKHLKIQRSQSSLLIKVDAWQLQQVLENLLSNAIHFSPESATIGCMWREYPREVLVEIWDQGAGLSAEDFAHVFTPFYSRRPGGTGLGLSIAQTIIQAHQGHLWVKNLPDGGAKFSFSLPRQFAKP